jgi:hypothetical protein
MGIEESKEVQAKGIENIFKKIDGKNFPNLERQLCSYKELFGHQQKKTRKETLQEIF